MLAARPLLRWLRPHVVPDLTGALPAVDVRAAVERVLQQPPDAEGPFLQAGDAIEPRRQAPDGLLILHVPSEQLLYNSAIVGVFLRYPTGHRALWAWPLVAERSPLHDFPFLGPTPHGRCDTLADR